MGEEALEMEKDYDALLLSFCERHKKPREHKKKQFNRAREDKDEI